MKRTYFKIILLLGLITVPFKAMETCLNPSLQSDGLHIPLLRQTPTTELKYIIGNADVGHLEDQSIVNKIELIDQLLLMESPPLSWPRFACQLTATLIHTFFAASASTGVFMYTSGDILQIPANSKIATGMILWLVLSRAPGIASQFWSMFQFEPWEKSEFIYQKDCRHHTVSIAVGLLAALNTSPWIYQMLWIEQSFLYDFAIPAAPFYFLMNAHMNYKLAAQQIDHYFYDYVYPKNSVYTHTKRKKLEQSIADARNVVKTADNKGMEIIFCSLFNKMHEVNSTNGKKGAYHLSSEDSEEIKVEESDIEEDNNDEVSNSLRLTPSEDGEISQSAMRMLLGMHENIEPITPDTQELAWQNAKSSTERVHDYPKLRRSLDRVTELVSAFDAVAHGFVLYNIFHFLPPGLAITGCGIGSAGRWFFHYAPRRKTMHTTLVDGLIKRSISVPLDWPLITTVGLKGIVNAGLLTTIPYILAEESLQTYSSNVRALLLGSLVMGNLLDYSRALIEDDLSLAEKDPSFSLRKGPCEIVNQCFRKTSGCVRSEINRKRLFIKFYSNRARRIVDQATEKFLGNLAYYFINEF